MQKIKIFLILLVVLLILGLASLIFVINTLPPDNRNSIMFFYLLVGLIGFSAATLIGFYLRRLFGQRELLNTYISTASRQGLWLAIILVVSFFLLHQQLFSWLNASLLILTFIFFESYLLTRNKDPQN